MKIKDTFLLLIKWFANTSFANLILKLVPNNKVIDVESPVSFIGKYKTLFFGKLARFNRSNVAIFRTAFYKQGEHIFKMELDINEFTQCGYYFSALDVELLRLIKIGGGVFIDVGANVGFYTLAAAKTFEKVYSFEPSPYTFARLDHNIKLNNYGSVTAIHSGLSNIKAKKDLHVNPLNNGGNSLNSFSKAVKHFYSDYDWGVMKVNVEVFDEVVQSRGIIGVDLIKIDVEGHELSVITGAKNTLLTYRPLVYAEVVKDRGKLNAIIRALPEGYIPYSLVDRKFLFEESVIPDDVLFCPSEKLSLLG